MSKWNERALVLVRGQRWRTLVGSGAVGVVVGVLVFSFHTIVEKWLLRPLFTAPLWAQALTPVLGMAIAWAVLRRPTPLSPSTADEYIRSYHHPSHLLGGWAMVRRMAAAIASLGTGAPMGLEGPSIYAGATIGALTRRRSRGLLHGTEARAFLVAGAAAGVAAVFRAPATGAVFAIEVPYQTDVAPRVELHAMTAAAAAYGTVAVLGDDRRLFQLVGDQPLVARNLASAAVVGLAAGILARGFAALLLRAKGATPSKPTFWLGVAGVPLGIWAVGALTDAPLGIAGGANVVEWLFAKSVPVGVLVALLGLRAMLTLAATASGGVGGIFIPMVTLGALLGKLVDNLTGGHEPQTLILVGAAAFLSAGYRTPLAALMFVAETTGRPNFVISGLIGVVAAQFVVGDSSVSSAQRRNRMTRFEQRAALPIAQAMSSSLKDISPDAGLDEFVHVMIPRSRERVLPITEDGAYVGVAVLDDALLADHDEWPTMTVSDIVRRKIPTLSPDRTVKDALAAMETSGLDQLPVVVNDELIGMVRRRDIQRWDELLERTAGPPG